jgi:hypothetical protein
MVGPTDMAGKPSLHDKGRLRSCGLGCLVSGAIFFLFLLVFGAGFGLPYTYWLQFEEFDLISKRGGWERLNRSSYMFEHDAPVVSHRHELRLLFVEDDQSQAIVADSISDLNHWSKPLVKVNTRRWKSYQTPMR